MSGWEPDISGKCLWNPDKKEGSDMSGQVAEHVRPEFLESGKGVGYVEFLESGKGVGYVWPDRSFGSRVDF
jgi:hypothetical protein